MGMRNKSIKKAIKVPKEEAETVRKRAEAIGAKDKSRLITVEGDYVLIPILEGYENEFDYEIVAQRNPLFAREKDIDEILKNMIPDELRRFIPKSYKVIGEVILVKLANELSDYGREVGEALLRIHPNCKSVWRDSGKEDMLRKPRLEFLAGDESYTETVKLENGCYFKLDVKKVMFSTGNQFEKIRIARLVQDGEVVVDMFAGIGYFSIPVAKLSGARKIYSIEINPDSYYYLLENIRLNEVRNIVPVLGNAMHVTPEGIADRVIMGHVFCENFIEVAIRALRDNGYIHYHESVPLAVKARPIKRLKDAAKKAGKKIEIENFRKVKNYSPGVIHVVVDAYLS
jgi:tRNA wybutosine-synthesizing protein 2